MNIEWEIRAPLEDIFHRIDEISKADQVPLVSLDASVEAWEDCASVLSRMRASGIPALLRLKKGDWVCELEELNFLVQGLRRKDQLTLTNLLELLGDLLPKETREVLEGESRIELKSFQEWLLAAHDPRIHKYPLLPWRSFIRKVIEENFEFASGAIDIFYMYGADADKSPELKKLVEAFLESKKRVLCLFPKKWNREQ